MPWVNLSRLLAHLRQRRIPLRDVTVFVDGELVDPRYRRPLAGYSTPVETDDSNDDDDDDDD